MESHTIAMFLSILLAYKVYGESILETKTVSTDLTATYKSWPVTSQIVTFRVRAAHDAVIILSTGPEGDINCYEIHFGAENNTQTLLRKDKVIHDGDLVEIETPNILNEDEFVSLWVSWRAGVIKAGKQNSEKSLFAYKDPNFIFPIRYLGVTTRKSAIGDWKIDRIPVAGVRKPLPQTTSTTMAPLTTPPPSTITGALNKGPTWVAASSDGVIVPPLAIAAGNTSDGEKVYIARALLKNAFGSGRDTLVPGKLVPSMRKAYIPFYYNAHSYSEYEVLCGDPTSVSWVSTTGGEIPPRSIPGGFSYKNNETEYVCRTTENGFKIPGKVHSSFPACYVSVGGIEIYKTEYEILVLNN